MKTMTSLFLMLFALSVYAKIPNQYRELLPYVQAAPNQAETNTCWFMASTGAMELLLNKKDNIRNSRAGGPNDLAESFLIWQDNFIDPLSPSSHFIEEVVKNFNHGEAVHIKHWPFKAFNSDGTHSMEAWNKHPQFRDLPRMKVPKVKTELLFARGKKWAMNVLTEKDLTLVKEALVTHRSPVIINYNDEGYWHVILIVGYDDNARGTCYQIDKANCNNRGAFYVRDSNGKKFELRAYNWFLYNGNAAAVVKLK